MRYALGRVYMLINEMEKAEKLDPELIKQCFEIGLMAIETPEEYGGAGSSFFNAILAIEELARRYRNRSLFSRAILADQQAAGLLAILR